MLFFHYNLQEYSNQRTYSRWLHFYANKIELKKTIGFPDLSKKNSSH